MIIEHLFLCTENLGENHSSKDYHLIFLAYTPFLAASLRRDRKGCRGLDRVSRRGKIETFYSEQGYARQGLMLQYLSSHPQEPVKLGIKFAWCDVFFFSSASRLQLSHPNFFHFIKVKKVMISVTVSEMESQENGMKNWRDGYVFHLSFWWLLFKCCSGKCQPQNSLF